MAAKKQTTTRKTTTGKSSQAAKSTRTAQARSSGASRSSARSRTGTRQTAKQPTRQPVKQTRISGSIRQEAWYLALLFLMVLVFLCICFGSGFGKAGNVIRTWIVGVFGIGAYLFSLFLIVFSAIRLFFKKFRVPAGKWFAWIVLLFDMCVMMHVVGGDPTVAAKELYNNAPWYSGGVIGAACGNWLMSMIGKAGTILVLLAVLVICIVVITEKSAVSAAIAAWIHARKATKNATDNVKDRIHQYEVQKRNERLEQKEAIQMPAEPVEVIPDLHEKRERIRAIAKTSNYVDDSDDIPDWMKRKPVQEEKDIKEVIREVRRPIKDGAVDIPLISYNDYQSKKQPADGSVPVRDDRKLQFFDDPQDAVVTIPVSAAAATADQPSQTMQTAANVQKEQTSYTSHTVQTDQAFRPEQLSLNDEHVPQKPLDSFTEPMRTGVPGGEKAVQKAAPVTASEQNQMDASIEKKLSTSQKARKYVFPSIELLNKSTPQSVGSRDEQYRNAQKLEKALYSFGVEATVTQVTKGPTVTRYELIPKQGVKVSRIVGLADDIRLNLAAPSVRIEAPIPGKSAVGIEVPNSVADTVFLRDIIESDTFRRSPSRLTFSLGKTVDGEIKVADIAKMPHLLIAGTTGSGKSVCINSMLISFLYKASPKELKLILIDPKVVELSIYNGIPHLLLPVVTDVRKAAASLNWAVSEMNKRYKTFADWNVRDIQGYNEALRDRRAEADTMEEIPENMPHIVIIIDELADLMMAAGKEVEEAIMRLTQMARAAGMHLVVATQRPSVDVITGVIKANIPSRLAFMVSSGVDSKTILDTVGAEKLLGRGDMLFWPIGATKATRIQGAFISDHEVERVIEAVKNQSSEPPEYDQDFMDTIESAGGAYPDAAGGDDDEYLEQAIAFVVDKQKASISMLQRVFRIGFNRAARLIDSMAERGIVGPDEGSKARKVLMTKEQYEALGSSEQNGY